MVSWLIDWLIDGGVVGIGGVRRAMGEKGDTTVHPYKHNCIHNNTDPTHPWS